MHASDGGTQLRPQVASTLRDSGLQIAATPTSKTNENPRDQRGFVLCWALSLRGVIARPQLSDGFAPARLPECTTPARL